MFHHGRKRSLNDAEKFMKFGGKNDWDPFGKKQYEAEKAREQQRQQPVAQNQYPNPYAQGGLLGQPAIGGGGMYAQGGIGGVNVGVGMGGGGVNVGLGGGNRMGMGMGGMGMGGYNPFPYLNPAYQATLYLIGPSKHIDLCREGNQEVAVDDTGRRLFNMMYSSAAMGPPPMQPGPMGPQPVHPAAAANMWRLNIIDFQGNVLVRADFPGNGGNASIWVGDRVIGTATIGRDVNSMMISTATPGSRNCFGFDGFGMEIKVYRLSSEEIGQRSRGHHFHHHFSNEPTVATFEVNPIKFGVDFCIEFTDPGLDVEGKVLILAVAQHVKTVKQGGGGGRGGPGGAGCCVIL